MPGHGNIGLTNNAIGLDHVFHISVTSGSQSYKPGGENLIRFPIIFIAYKNIECYD